MRKAEQSTKKTKEKLKAKRDPADQERLGMGSGRVHLADSGDRIVDAPKEQDVEQQPEYTLLRTPI